MLSLNILEQRNKFATLPYIEGHGHHEAKAHSGVLTLPRRRENYLPSSTRACRKLQQNSTFLLTLQPNFVAQCWRLLYLGLPSFR